MNQSNEQTSELSKKVNSLKNDFENKRNENDVLKTELEDKKQANGRLNLETQNLIGQNEQQKVINQELQSQIEELLAIIAELKCKQKDLNNSLDQDENGGSNGWSDLGDVEVDGVDNSKNGEDNGITEEVNLLDNTSESSKKEIEKKETKKSSKKWTSDNLFEVAKLKTKLRKIEAERNNLQ